MKLPNAPKGYDQANESQARKAIEDADAANLKRGQDVQLLRGERLIEKASTGGNRFVIFVDSTGRLCTQETS